MIEIALMIFQRVAASGMRRHAVQLVLLLSAACSLAVPVRATETVALYAAGSLRDALGEIARTFQTATGTKIVTKFGPSGLLKDEIAAGAQADVFASANMEHPQALHAAGKSGPVILFARNRLCALVKPGLKVDSGGLLERMLDPQIKLGTSTPKADPSGDYAFEVFRKADALKPGARAELEKKALQLTGNPSSAQPPQGRAVYGWHVAEGRADIFLAYCTATAEAKKQNPDQQIVELPASLSVGADYGLTVMSGAAQPAPALARFIVSPAGQKILAGYGFAPAQP